MRRVELNVFFSALCELTEPCILRLRTMRFRLLGRAPLDRCLWQTELLYFMQEIVREVNNK